MFKTLFPNKYPMIGMIHLPPLPGYPTSPGIRAIIKKALTDLKTLEKAGFDGALVENDNDQPHQIVVSPQIAEAFATVMRAIHKVADIPVGMEIIYDMKQTILVAHETHAPFVRLDVFVDTVKTQWGTIVAQPREIQSHIQKLNADNLVILTDIHVKHAQLVKKKNLRQSSQEALEHGSDGLIVTGTWTGKRPSFSDCKTMKRVAKSTPVLAGSGFDLQNAPSLLKYCDGAIVGTSIKTGNFINFEKAQALIRKVRTL